MSAHDMLRCVLLAWVGVGFLGAARLVPKLVRAADLGAVKAMDVYYSRRERTPVLIAVVKVSIFVGAIVTLAIRGVIKGPFMHVRLARRPKPG